MPESGCSCACSVWRCAQCRQAGRLAGGRLAWGRGDQSDQSAWRDEWHKWLVRSVGRRADVSSGGVGFLVQRHRVSRNGGVETVQVWQGKAVRAGQDRARNGNGRKEETIKSVDGPEEGY